MIPLEQLLTRFDNTRKNGVGWTARCPAHEDRRNSLSISCAEDGKLLLNCFAGCPTEAVISKSGLAWADLFPEEHVADKRPAKPRIVQAYDYCDETGRLLYQNVRYEPKDFRLRCPDGRDGWTWKLNGTQRVLYRLPELLEAIALGKTVFVAEGEKDAERLWAVRLPATTSGGAKSWKPAFAEVFRGAEVVIVPHRDRAGEDYAQTVAQSLQGIAARVQIVILPLPWREKNGLDVSDFLQHHSAEELLALLEPAKPGPANVWDTAEQPADRQQPTPSSGTSSRPVPRFLNSDELLSKQLDPVRWVVPGILTEGLWLLCGKPKMGKSWLALALCVATAAGGRALGKIELPPGDVLYLPLEDNERRFKSRLEKILDSEPVRPSLKRLSYLLECPRLNQGGIELIESWLQEHPEARLLVVDTLAKVKPARSRSNNSLYDEDYGAVQGLKSLSDRYQVAILVVHHLRKAAAEDVQDTINATTGLAGGVDGTLILQRARGKASATLHIDGRDVPEVQELAIDWDQRTAQWTLMGDAEEFRLSQAQSTVIAALKEAKQPLGPKALYELLQRDEPNLSMNAVKMRLRQMVATGLLLALDRGRYALPDLDPTKG